MAIRTIINEALSEYSHQRAGLRQLLGGGVHFESQQKLIWRWQRRF